MDPTRLDRLARSLAERRTVVRTLAGLPLAAVATGAERGVISTAAQRKKKGNGNCEPSCPKGEVCLAGKCTLFCDVCASGCLFNRISPALATAPPGATVILCPETFTEPTTINVLKDVTLVGAGGDPTKTVLQGSATVNPVLTVQPGATATVRNLTITGVQSTSFGAITNHGTLTLESVEVIDNQGDDFGGIINFSGGVLTLTDSLVEGNTSGVPGGGIRNGTSATVTLINSKVKGNQAPQGGGVAVDDGGTLNLEKESRISGNTATDPAGDVGGGVFNEGTVTLSGKSKITNNTPDNCVNVNTGTGCP
jgi:hypothetical protein